MKKDEEPFVIQLDSVEEALIGAMAKQNGITKAEQLRLIIRAELDKAARITIAGRAVSRH